MTYPDTELRVLGNLLKGGCSLFGKRIEIAWPDGFTEEDLRKFADQWDPEPLGRWVIDGARMP
jgi:hypothetical protein